MEPPEPNAQAVSPASEHAAAPSASIPAAAVPAGPAEAPDALDLIARLINAVEPSQLLAVHGMDAAGHILFWNAGCVELYGIAPDDALGRPLDSLLAFERNAEHGAVLADAWSSGQASPARDWQVATLAGSRLWVSSMLFPVSHDGRVQQVFCIDADITARRMEDEALRTAGRNFRQLYLRSSDAILLLQGERITDLNPAAMALFKGQRREDMVGRRLHDFSTRQIPDEAAPTPSPALPPDAAPGSLAGDAAASQSGSPAEASLRYDWRFLNCAGEPFWAEVLMTSIKADHGHLFYVVVRDISARKQAERTLHLAAQVFDHARDAIVLTDGSRNIIAVNRSFTLITGYTAEDILGSPLQLQRADAAMPATLHANVHESVHTSPHDHAHDFQRMVWQEMDATGYWQGEIGGRRKSGGMFPGWLSLTTIRDSAGQVSNYMGMLSDITDRKRSEDQTRHLAEHDFLTDLPNRVLLLDRLSLALATARRNHTMLAVLFIDLDRFKEVNDTLGHQVGDELLKEIAARLVKCVRGADTVSRQGGDEFLIILADIGGVDQAAHVAGSVLAAIGQPFQLGPHLLQVSASIGISIYPNDGDGIDQLINNADVAMYHAKESGRNGFQFFNSEMHAQIAERVNLENGLRQALRRQEFELVFHPEIDLASGQPVGMEALLRWRHPEFGLLRPERFIAAAEEAGLMIPIGNWVLQQACRSAQRWREAGHPLLVAVNLSAAQFGQKHLLAAVREALVLSGLDAAWLELELTETVLMKGGAAAQQTLLALHGMGVRLTIDDFGTGYSRLGHLKDYPVNKLKIDQSFIAALDGNTAVIGAMVAMARSLDMLAIAEGVETQQQLDFLRSIGCHQYQGYLADALVQAGPLGRLLT